MTSKAFTTVDDGLVVKHLGDGRFELEWEKGDPRWEFLNEEGVQEEIRQDVQNNVTAWRTLHNY